MSKNLISLDGVVIQTAFGPVLLPPTQEVTEKREEDIVKHLVVKEYVKGDDGKVKEVEKLIESDRINRADYINSFNDECGIQNILKKIGQGVVAEDKFDITKDMPEGTINDITFLGDVEDYGDIVNMAKNARATYDALDPDLKGDMSFAKFCESFNNDMLNSYVKKALKIEDKKEGQE